ncbi:MAG: DUF4424 family protein [Deltaproteobacteria bacterium]|nr:DUF4424 family protein [Deltaproteobacteria bacterium]
MSFRLLAAAAALIVTLLPGGAQANLIAYSGESGSIMPVDDVGVEMIDERLVLHESGKVKATYTFWNTSGKERTLLVGFPVLHGSEMTDEGEKTVSVQKFRATVNGETVEHRSETPKCPAAGEGCHDEVYVFDVTFPPKQNVTVKCTYTQPPSRWSTSGSYLSFILETGKGWKGDIGNFNLYVSIPHPVCSPLDVFGGLFWPMAECTSCTDAEPPDGLFFCQGKAEAKKHCKKGLERITARKGTIELWASKTAFLYTVKATPSKTTLNLWAQDFEPGGNITVFVPESPEPCVWDEALVIGPLEEKCRFSEVVKAKKNGIAQLASELEPGRAEACKGLPDYLMNGGAVFSRETYGGVHTSLIEEHHVPGQINKIPLYMKGGLVPGLKTFGKKLKQILAQM